MMVIKGARRGGAKQLADHLLRRDTNESVFVREIENHPTTTPNDDALKNALKHMEHEARSKHRERTLYHCILALQKGETLNQKQLKLAVDTLANNLGLAGHRRVIVEHRKDGRQHFHVVFNLINPHTDKIAWLSWSRRKQWQTARDLEQKFGLKPLFAKGRSSRQWEHQRGKRSGIDPLNVRKEVTAIYRASRTGREFAANLEKAGYVLTKGRNNSYVIVDRAGDLHGLMRRIEGAKLVDLRRKFPDLKEIRLPVLEDVIRQRKPQKPRYRRTTGRQGNSGTSMSVVRISPVMVTPARRVMQNKYARLKTLAVRIGRSPQAKQSGYMPFPMRRRKRKKDENIPDSEKVPFRRPEWDASEIIAWAYETGRLDVLAAYGIHLSPESFEI